MTESLASANTAAIPAISERRRTAAFVCVLIAVVLEVADTTIVNTALPAIRESLNASAGAMQWIVAGYLLALGALLLLGGRLGDALGHARVFLWGIGLFVVASALCGLARDAGELVAARLVQGAAAALMAPQGMALVQLLFSPLERVTRMAMFGLIVGLAAIIGPVLGGILIELDLFGLGWRLIFLINLPIGLAAIVLGRMVLPPAETHTSLRVDPLGAAIFAVGFGALLYALIDGAENGLRPIIAGLAITGVVLLVAGWKRAGKRRAAQLPSIIAPELFAIGTFCWGTVSAFAFSAGSMGFLLVFAVALQQGLGQSPLDTALVHIPFGLGVMAGVAVLVPKLLPRFGKWLPLAGGLAMIIGTLATLALIACGDGGSAALVAALTLAGVGMGALSGPLGPIVVAEVSRAQAGTASATFRTSQQVGGALGIALAGSAYFALSGAGASLAGLLPAAIVITVLLALAMLAVWRLPKQLFAKEGH